MPAQEVFDEGADGQGLAVTDLPNALLDFFGVAPPNTAGYLMESQIGYS